MVYVPLAVHSGLEVFIVVWKSPLLSTVSWWIQQHFLSDQKLSLSQSVPIWVLVHDRWHLLLIVGHRQFCLSTPRIGRIWLSTTECICIGYTCISRWLSKMPAKLPTRAAVARIANNAYSFWVLILSAIKRYHLFMLYLKNEKSRVS